MYLLLSASGFAGVYFEKVLKGANADLWVRNIQLTLFSLPPALLAALFPDFSIRSFLFANEARIQVANPNAPSWLFGNFGFWALATVFCQVFGGLVTALVIRYSDNIAKGTSAYWSYRQRSTTHLCGLLAGFATSLSIIISFMAGVILFNFQVTTPFLVGCSMVLTATWFYNQPEGDGSARLKQAAYRPLPNAVPEIRTNGHARSTSQSYSMDPSSARRFTGISDAGSVGEDPVYPYASYPNTSAQPPKFINLSPFMANQPSSGISGGPAFLQEENVSPKSPIPPFVEGQPFGPSSKEA